MPVSQDFINLLHLPVAELETIAEALEIEIPKGTRKWDLVRLISRASTQKLTAHAGQWIFAGKTSVTFIRLGDGSPLDRDQIVAALTDMCDGQNPFSEDVRPAELTSRPALIDATEHEGRIFLSFGLKRPVAEVISDFEIQPVEADHFFAAVLRPDVAILEVRTNNQRARRLATTWVTDFCNFFDEDAQEEAVV